MDVFFGRDRRVSALRMELFGLAPVSLPIGVGAWAPPAQVSVWRLIRSFAFMTNQSLVTEPPPLLRCSIPSSP